MEKLGLYPLSIILTYLCERDGTCFLLTKRHYAKQILPMFRVRNYTTNVTPGERYRFQVSPVQGPVVLLQRLNTRRLRKRRRRANNGGNVTNDKIIKGLSTVELANWEWTQMQMAQQNNGQAFPYQFPYPPPLELLRFLNQTPQQPSSPLELLAQNGITLLLSYPRSGNTLLRTLLERTTGIVTGSDTRPDRTLSKALATAHNLVGEGVVQGAFVKTHWPERTGWKICTGQRGILLVRNPYDAIDSYWNLNVTNTHTETVTDEIYERFHDKFEGLVKNEIQVWCQYHQYWLDKRDYDNFPLLIIRFEDLIQQPTVEVTRILEFVMSSSSTGGKTTRDPFWRQRVQHATTTSNAASSSTPATVSLGSYQPRTATRGVQSIGKSLHKGRYSQAVLDYFHQVGATQVRVEDDNDTVGSNQTLFQQFGYDIYQQSFPENFVQGTEPSVQTLNQGNSSNNSALPHPPSSEPSEVRVNTGNYLIRPATCQFGRSMRSWRLQHTENDTQPFPRVPRESLQPQQQAVQSQQQAVQSGRETTTPRSQQQAVQTASS